MQHPEGEAGQPGDSENPGGQPAAEASNPAPAPGAPAVPPPAPQVEISTDVERAAGILRAGGLVAIPTETVYGLACDARSEEALKRLYKVKGRPGSHPVIVHVADRSALTDWGREVPDYAEQLAARFWPGPLTLVVKRAPGVLDAITGGQDTVGLRMPAHPMARAVLEALDQGQAPRYGLAAPSANRFGRVSPTQAEHVRHDLNTDIDLVLDGGPCEVGIESTIVDCSGDTPAILRPGRISAADIEACLGLASGALGAAAQGAAPAGEGTTRAPGTLPHHYAPRAKLRLLKRSGIIETLALPKAGQRVAALALEIPVARVAAGLCIVVPAVAASYARSLYANLRLLDAAGADVILVESPPETPAWASVLDRLRRAATPVDAAKGKKKREGVVADEATGEVPAGEPVAEAAGSGSTATVFEWPKGPPLA
jgi:L-threonylcarbamoyladenylate synthase